MPDKILAKIIKGIVQMQIYIPYTCVRLAIATELQTKMFKPDVETVDPKERQN